MFGKGQESFISLEPHRRPTTAGAIFHMRIQIEIDELGRVWDGDQIIQPNDIKPKAQEIFDSGLTHMHSVKFPFGLQRVLIFTEKKH